MSDGWLHSLVLTFVPLFIVIDALGTVPFVVSLSEGLNRKEHYRLINIATVTAVAVGLIFLFFGQFILKAMGISPGSFTIAGGLILLILSIRYIFTGQFIDAIKEEMVAIVPIGTPLTVGPATITTLLLLATQYNIWMVLLSFALNMLLTWVIFITGNHITRFLGKGGLKAISKVFSLLLAAIAVSMIISGLSTLGILHLPAP
jgi:multiple antibiotic resistance protein